MKKILTSLFVLLFLVACSKNNGNDSNIFNDPNRDIVIEEQTIILEPPAAPGIEGPELIQNGNFERTSHG